MCCNDGPSRSYDCSQLQEPVTGRKNRFAHTWFTQTSSWGLYLPPYYTQRSSLCFIAVLTAACINSQRSGPFQWVACLGPAQCCLFTSLANCGLWASAGITVCSPRSRNKLRADVFISHRDSPTLFFSPSPDKMVLPVNISVFVKSFYVARMAQPVQSSGWIPFIWSHDRT